MNIIPVELSIVIAGEDCNPTFLNPDFLRYREIVPEQWGWELADAPITTRGLSIVSYTSDVLIKVEPNRFQVTDSSGITDATQSKAIQIARRYIEILPHVRYTAVGNNVQLFLEVDDPVQFLQKHFVNPGSLAHQESDLRDIELSFTYNREDARLTISFENNVLLREQDDKVKQIPGVEITANFHRECTGYPTDQQVLSHIDKMAGDVSSFEQILHRLLPAEI